MEKFGFFFLAFLTAVFCNDIFVALLEFRNSNWFRVIFVLSVENLSLSSIDTKENKNYETEKEIIVIFFFFSISSFSRMNEQTMKEKKINFFKC